MSVNAAFERLVDRAVLFGYVAAPDVHVIDFDPQLGPGFLAAGKPEPCRALPPPCQYDTPGMAMDGIGCKPRPDAKYVFVDGSGWQLAEPKPEPTIERPTKTEYIRAFQAEARATRRPLPSAVWDRWDKANDLVARYTMDQSMPRSARRALDQYRGSDLSCAYDRGLVGRIVYYCESHKRRAYAGKCLSTPKGIAR